MPQPSDVQIKTLAHCKLPDYSTDNPGVQNNQAIGNEILTLEQIERQSVEQDRAGILFSNVLK